MHGRRQKDVRLELLQLYVRAAEPAAPRRRVHGLLRGAVPERPGVPATHEDAGHVQLPGPQKQIPVAD